MIKLIKKSKLELFLILMYLLIFCSIYWKLIYIKNNQMQSNIENKETSKSYNVVSIEKDNLVITGKGSDQKWNDAKLLSCFCSPWDKKPFNKIEFKALHNSDKIFFLFKVEDTQIHLNSSENKYDSINNSDRVELFFRRDITLNPYYCLEIDPSGRIMDFMARPNKQFDFNWNWPEEDIIVKSSIESTFFTVEIGISIASLRHFGVIKNGKIETGIYRAKYNQQEKRSYEPTWITWVNPKTETPNFHTPTSFGLLNLEGYNSH
jgi:hypothetical protein